MHKVSDHQRIVVKVGSALLVQAATGSLNTSWLDALADDLKALTDAGKDVLVVSSGSIALGRNVLHLPRGPLKLPEAQAAAAVGQVALAGAWAGALKERGLTAAQILLTWYDTEERRRYLNARATLGTLMQMRAIPVINENDTVATAEIRYGDNDRLAARVAAMVGADCLVLLSDIDGLYTAPPQTDPHAEFIPHVPVISAEIEAMAGAAGSEFSRGGMKTKIEAGKIATAAGAAMVIASGRVQNPLAAIDDGARCTWFDPQSTPASARKAWIAGHLEPRGTITVDAGAVAALRSGKSLLPAGVVGVNGAFARGDAVVIVSREGAEIGRGLVGFDRDDACKIAGHRTQEIETLLGYSGRAAMIHRDDMVLRDG
ncbi:glutamate 5-kinase [Faunimonas pinastri]|uniref:Glutamate 5-kinase n=1 Tax=Faunimonas pinastri TaxID=1855383 RepID=A0A1H9MJ53_9HYPH|nr:glutamate 5-kinase [Faunimonas pinastri]SER23726.1 glutamate 5-kinase [Faunimonas pinastri]